ncbi:MAG: ribonuclease III [Bacteriovoracaceae bacterium]
MKQNKSDAFIALETLQKKLGYQFVNQNLLVNALTHKSYWHENLPLNSPLHYERLEFLGDALLGFIVAEILYETLPEESEGVYSKMRCAIVNEERLFETASCVDLENFIFIGNGITREQLKINKNILSSTLESILAAIYLDSKDIAVVKKCVLQLLAELESQKNIKLIDPAILMSSDPKSTLQSCVLLNLKSYPYIKLSGNGPFVVEVSIRGVALGSLEGESKKNTEKKLAQTILNSNLISEIGLC